LRNILWNDEPSLLVIELNGFVIALGWEGQSYFGVYVRFHGSLVFLTMIERGWRGLLKHDMLWGWDIRSPFDIVSQLGEPRHDMQVSFIVWSGLHGSFMDLLSTSIVVCENPKSTSRGQFLQRRGYGRETSRMGELIFMLSKTAGFAECSLRSKRFT